jgi:membrane-associated phospholipid phosphatase
MNGRNLGEMGAIAVLADLLKSIDLGTYYSFNEAINRFPALHDLMHVGNWIGSYIGVGVLTGAAIIVLLVQGRTRGAVIVLGALIVAALGVELLRLSVPANRPDVAAALVGEDEMLRSFPAREVLTFTLATTLLLVAIWPSLYHWMARPILTADLVILVLWVAMSQLMLGLHFVTDVAAGLFGGLALGLLAGRFYSGASKRHSHIEAPG